MSRVGVTVFEVCLADLLCGISQLLSFGDVAVMRILFE